MPGQDDASTGAYVTALGERASAAARVVATLSAERRDAALRAAADELEARADAICAVNGDDVAAGRDAGTSDTLLDRLRLDGRRVTAMASGLRQVAALPDPVGEIADGWTRPNGLRVRRVRVPLGVVAVIYEMRPNVTSDAAGLCLKSGNAALLRGSSAAIRTNTAVADALRSGYGSAGVPPDALVLVERTDRATATAVMQLRDHVDCLIPRGGRGLIRSILDHATVPYVIDGDGNCHIYVDAHADLDAAVEITVNAKTQRDSVCNAAESLLVHDKVADAFLPLVADALGAAAVELVGDERSRQVVDRIGAATDDDFATEFLGPKLSVAVVPSLDGAIDHIARYGSGHSEAIVTRDLDAAARFTREVDAAAVLVNASTRFVDGEELGFGAEIGISTQKLHARGPMGLEQLTTLKFVVEGDGHVRA